MSRTIETAVDIAASPEKVWSVLADLPAYATWNPYYRSAKGRLEVGHRVQLEAAIDDSGATSVSRPLVTDVESGRRATWRNRFVLPGLLTTTHTFTLVPLGSYWTRLEQTESFTGLLVPLSGSIIEQIHQRLQQLGEAAKKRSEA